MNSKKSKFGLGSPKVNFKATGKTEKSICYYIISRFTGAGFYQQNIRVIGR
jgi:hypothetical protein